MEREDPEVLRIDGARIELHQNLITITEFPGHGFVLAYPQDTPAYRQRAREHGYGRETAAMSRDHELCHSLLSHWLGLPRSAALFSVAVGENAGRLGQLEETAVMAVQALAKAAGVDLVQLAREIGRARLSAALDSVGDNT